MKFPLFGYLATYAYGLPVLAGILRFRLLNKSESVFFLFCIFSLAGVVAEDILSLFGFHNHLFINSFRLMEIIFITFLFQLWSGDRRFRMLSRILALLFIAIWIITNMLIVHEGPFNIVDAVVANIIRIILSALLLFEVIYRSRNTVPYSSNPLFWIASGLFFYNSIAIVILSLSNWLLQQGIPYFSFAWHINWSLSILCNIAFSYSYFLKRA